MSHPEVRTIRVSNHRLSELGQILTNEASTEGWIDDIGGDHLTDEQVVGIAAGTLAGAQATRARGHLSTCESCSAEVARMRQLATVWEDESAIAALEKRIKGALWSSEGPTSKAADTLERIWDAVQSPFAVSLKSMMIPQGAYGETKLDETSTLEFFITQEGKIVEGLRGLLKRVNREYYVRIFAVDPNARSRYGDRKALISISDTYQERPILHRKIDIGVTVLLGTDFRLTDNSSLAVEMLPSVN